MKCLRIRLAKSKFRMPALDWACASCRLIKCCGTSRRDLFLVLHRIDCMSLHKEIEFENDICAHLAAHDWLYAENDHTGYDRARAMFPADVLAWVQATQPQAWETLAKNNGAAAEAVLLDRIRKQLDDGGTLDVLRHGVELLGLRQPLSLAQFKPALAMNAALQARYGTNRLRVVRQGRALLPNQKTTG